MHLYELILPSDDTKIYILWIYLSVYDKDREWEREIRMRMCEIPCMISNMCGAMN